ncbi:MAG: chemotaxis protein CheA, partial [Negativicutes bacterium]|nr:chemotaxis protein CheA [Negativicutes bacterium]
MDMNQYISIFLDESREHLQNLNECLLKLENDPGNVSLFDEIFRGAHTIKGTSATMGFTAIAELTHEMENLLDLLRTGSRTVDEQIINVLFRCLDTLEHMVECVASGEEFTGEVDGLIAALRAIISGQPAAVAAIGQAAAAEPATGGDAERRGGVLPVWEIKVGLKPGTVLKSVRVYMVLNALEDRGEVVGCQPSQEDLEKENFDLNFSVFLETSADIQAIKGMLEGISEVDSVEIIRAGDRKIAEVTDRYSVSAIDTRPDQADIPPEDESPTGEELPPEPVVSAQPSPDRMVERPRSEPPARPVAGADSSVRRSRATQSVRVDIEKLDTMINLVGELVINKTRLEQISLTRKMEDWAETIEQFTRVTNDLQAVVMKVRMVQIGQVFNRFPRMIRDLSHELDKEIIFHVEGEETELDRTVIDEIGDPLVHLLRNSVDHGIEPPEQRVAAGKPRAGRINLIARHEGNNVIILVEDDGQGINTEKLKRKAVEKGLISQFEIDRMDQAEAVRLLFLPGLSTSEKVTDVSGRGVGMDAVKNKLEAIGGTVDVETRQGVGTKFKLRLPLTMAIIQALLVKVAREVYAIALVNVDNIINIRADDIKTVQQQEVILLRGQVIPIVRLAERLAVPTDDTKVKDELYVVVVRVGDQRMGIVVDE